MTRELDGVEHRKRTLAVRLRFTISGVYEVDLSDDNMVVAYGSTVPAEIAKIELSQLADNPVEFLAWIDAQELSYDVEAIT